MDCSTSGFPVYHQLLEATQTHVHRVSDAIQLSHPLSFCSPAFSLSQHQGLSQGASSLHQVDNIKMSSNTPVLLKSMYISLDLAHQTHCYIPGT